jgi:hypothetical protein
LALVLGLLAWGRYLHHKETMKSLEVGGDAPRHLESLSHARMEAQERRRLRSGMMAGVVVTALGLGVLSNLLLRPQMMDPDTRALVVGLVVFLLITGVANFVAHVVWSRDQVAHWGKTPADRAPGLDAVSDRDSQGTE